MLLFSPRESSLAALTTSFLQRTPKSSHVLLGKSDDLSELQIPQLYHMDGLNDFLMSLAFLKFSDSTNYRDVNSLFFFCQNPNQHLWQVSGYFIWVFHRHSTD